MEDDVETEVSKMIQRPERSRRWTDSGFSLLEIALFIAIVGIGFITLINVLTGISGNSVHSMLRDAMVNAAQRQLDEIRIAGYYSAPDFDNTTVTVNSGNYEVTVTTQVDYLKEDLQDTLSYDDRRIRVTVTAEMEDMNPVDIKMLMTPLDALQ